VREGVNNRPRRPSRDRSRRPGHLAPGGGGRASGRWGAGARAGRV